MEAFLAVRQKLACFRLWKETAKMSADIDQQIGLSNLFSLNSAKDIVKVSKINFVHGEKDSNYSPKNQVKEGKCLSKR